MKSVSTNPIAGADVAFTQSKVSRYARFTTRVQAMMIDSIIFTLAIVCTLSFVTMMDQRDVARVVGFGVLGATLLYEPILVSWTGGTVGHWLRNLRVVDDRTGGNVGFLRAVAHFAIKLILGLFSFLSMATTNRYQAIHDLITPSTVQPRDHSIAKAHHYAVAASEKGVTGPYLSL